MAISTWTPTGLNTGKAASPYKSLGPSRSQQQQMA